MLLPGKKLIQQNMDYETTQKSWPGYLWGLIHQKFKIVSWLNYFISLYKLMMAMALCNLLLMKIKDIWDLGPIWIYQSRKWPQIGLLMIV